MWPRIALGLALLMPLSGFPDAGKQALVLGGSGDDPGSDTTFDKAASIYLSRLKSGGYEVSANFSGNRPDTIAVFRQAGVPRSEATLPGVRASVRELLDGIKQGKTKQVVVYVDSHGKPKAGEQLSHSVLLEDGKFDLDELKPVRDAAEAAGVPLTIVDGSCFGGSSLVLAGARTCAVSFASPHTEGWAHYSTDFAKEMKAGKSMEAIFLDMMENSLTFPSIPRISTESGRVVAEKLRFLEENTIANQDELLDSLLEATPRGLAGRGSDFTPFNAQFLKSLRETGLSLSAQDLSKIGKDLREYQAAYLDLREAVKNLPKRPESQWPPIEDVPCVTQTSSLPLDPAKVADQFKDYRKSLKPKELLLARLATEVTKHYKSLYLKLYRQHQKKNPARTQEACARFSL